MASFGNRLRDTMLEEGFAAPLETSSIEIEAYHPVRGRFRAQIRPLLRVGQDGRIWFSPGSLIDRHGAARVLDALHQQFPSQSTHLLLHPLPLFGQVSPWALERAIFHPGESQTRCSGIVLGEGPKESEAAGRYLIELTQQCQLMRGSELRSYWRKMLSGASFRHWLLEELQAVVPDGATSHAWAQGWTDLWNSFAGLSRPRLEQLQEQIGAADPTLRDPLWCIGLAWILNQPSKRKPHPHKGQENPNRAKRHDLFRRPWAAGDFPAMAYYPELRPLIKSLAPIRPLSFHGMEAAWQKIPMVEHPWVDHLASTALRDIVNLALQQHAIHHLDLEDLFQEGLVGAVEAAHRYEAYDDDGIFQPFRAYASFWIWQRIRRQCQDLGHLIRRPVWHYEGDSGHRKGAPWTRKPEGLSPGHRLTPIVPLEASLVDPMGEGALTVGEVLGCFGAPHSAYKEPGTLSVRDFAQGLHHVPDPTPFTEFEQRQTRRFVKQTLRTLRTREQEVLRLRFGMDGGGLEHTLEEIGQTMGVTRERIRQIEANAFQKMQYRVRRALQAPLPLKELAPPSQVPQSGLPKANPVPRMAPDAFTLDRTVPSIREALAQLERAYGPDKVPEILQVPIGHVLRWKSGSLPNNHFFERIQQALAQTQQEMP